MQPGGQGVAASDRAGPRTRTRKVAWKASSAACGSREQAAADPQDHRPVPLDERGERQLGSLAPRPSEPFEELAVAQPGDRPDVEQRLQLTPGCAPLGTISAPLAPGCPSVVSRQGDVCSIFSGE